MTPREQVTQMHELLEQASRAASWGYQERYGRLADADTDYFSRALGQEINFSFETLPSDEPRAALVKILDSLINGMYEIKSALEAQV